jgi:hypothetical protein
MKRSEDDAFRFTLSWMTTNQNEKGWVIHYRAKNQPVSAEVMPVLGFLGLRIFNECQFFDFEECWWTDFAYSTRGGQCCNVRSKALCKILAGQSGGESKAEQA